MNDLTFFRARRPAALAAIATVVGAAIPDGFDPARLFDGLAPPASAGRHHVTVATGQTSEADLSATRAGLCLGRPSVQGALGPDTCLLTCDAPEAALLAVAALMETGRLDRDGSHLTAGIDPRAHVESGALVETRVVLGPGVLVCAGAEIGMESVIGAYAVIGPGVRLGRRCTVEAHATITNALVGDGVMIRAGSRIGQAPMPPAGSAGCAIGRVIVQDACVIGANSVIERGHIGETVLGEGCRVAPLATIAAETTIGRFTHFP